MLCRPSNWDANDGGTFRLLVCVLNTKKKCNIIFVNKRIMAIVTVITTENVNATKRHWKKIERETDF